MQREGPGYLGDLAFLWLTLAACFGAGHLVRLLVAEYAFGGTAGAYLGSFFGILTAIVVGFFALWAYYRVFLDERPLFGTESRTRFVVLAVQVTVLTFVFLILFVPPDPITQGLVTLGAVAFGVGVAYWSVYHRASDDAVAPDPR